MKIYVIATIVLVFVLALIIVCIKLYNRLNKLRIKVEESFSDIDVALEKRYDLLTEELNAVKKYLSHEYKLLTDVAAVRSGAKQEEKNRIQQNKLTEEALKTIDKQIEEQTQNMESIKKQLSQNLPHNKRKRRSSQNIEIKKHFQNEQKLEQNIEKNDVSHAQRVNLLLNAQKNLTNVGATVNALSEQYPVLNSWISMEAFQRSIVNSEEHLQASRRLYNSNVSLYNQLITAIPWCFIARLFQMEKGRFFEADENKRSFSGNFD